VRPGRATAVFCGDRPGRSRTCGISVGTSTGLILPSCVTLRKMANTTAESPRAARKDDRRRCRRSKRELQVLWQQFERVGVAWPDDGEVATVERGDPDCAIPFSQGDHGRVRPTEP
jgi:hypothetical protein